MIYDRPYMSTRFDKRSQDALLRLIGINVGVFILQNLLPAIGVPDFIGPWFALSHDSISSGKVWTLISYSFLHGGLVHLLFNCLGIYLLGRSLLEEISLKQFFEVYFMAVLGGALLWYASSFFNVSGLLLGASGGVFGLLALFALLHPNQEVQFLLFLVLPVRVQRKVIGIVLLGISALGFLIDEALGSQRIAHSAHLGGMLGAFIYLKAFFGRDTPSKSAGSSIHLPRWLSRKKPAKSSTSFNYTVNVRPETDMKAEIDRILDKINSKGFGSLTQKEKETLDQAGDLLKRR